MTAEYDIAIIGGGASGLMAALQTDPKSRVIVLERQDRVGRKLLATGNGRCNLTNMHAAERGYHGDAKEAIQIIQYFPPEEIRRFFYEQLGLLTVIEEDGLVYPLCGQASAVLDSMRFALTEKGIEIRCGFECAKIARTKSGFTISSKENETVRARKVILCGGGMAAPKLGGTDSCVKMLQQSGHRVVQRRPALTQIDLCSPLCRSLKGQRFRGTAALMCGNSCVGNEEGEILFTETGVSGIAVMQLSESAANKNMQLHLRLLEGVPDLYIRRQQRAHCEINDFLTGIVAKRIGQAICKQAGIAPLDRPCETLSENELRKIEGLLKDWLFEISGVKGFENAQVTAGGACLCDFDTKTLESRIIPGLYAAGEALNVHGDCGGYNLTWAWASGALCARSASAALRKGEIPQ